jgi:hypothetical protein
VQVSGRGHGRFWFPPARVIIAHRFGFAQVHGVRPRTMPRCWGSVATTRISEVWLRLLEAYGL